MSRITADEAMVRALSGLEGPVVVCDASGKVLGRYFPDVAPADRDLLRVARQRFDLAEANRRLAAEPEGLSAEEVKRRLSELESRS